MTMAGQLRIPGTEANATQLRFGGATFDPHHDGPRLARQFGAVRALVLDGEWHTLRELADAIGAPEASVSARLRDLRKPEGGGYIVERRRRGNPANGLHEYRVVIPDEGPSS